MSEDRQAGAGPVQLPREFVDRLTKPFAKFLGIEAAAGAVLLLLAYVGSRFVFEVLLQRPALT